MRTIAALYVERNGSYAGMDGVECWDEKRDARLYGGPHPVVAHPPCARWCRLAGFVEARWGHKRGDDGGMFFSALEMVRCWGGVLEHPAYSAAWKAHGLERPSRHGGWTKADNRGGRTCQIDQGRYGHPAKKSTWLYAHSTGPLPELCWGWEPDTSSDSPLSWCGNEVKNGRKRPRVSKRMALATPPAFRDVLLEIAARSR